jgi:endonuclease G
MSAEADLLSAFPPAGYDADFLEVPLPLPVPVVPGLVRELTYTHFTVLLHARRRLAVATGVNIDGAHLVDVDRGDAWHLDPRIPSQEQTGEAVYARNDLDRGHLVRRRDPVWGAAAVARQANIDTFAYPNAAPQAGAFNQSKELWLGLEDHVLAFARANSNRISVFTAPVLGEDPVYRGVGIPQAFWKIAAWTTMKTMKNGSPVLQSAGFILDQSPQLADIDLEEVRTQALLEATPPPLGPFRTFQVPVADIGVLFGLDLGVLSEADALVPLPAVREGAAPRELWVELSSAAVGRGRNSLPSFRG